MVDSKEYMVPTCSTFKNIGLTYYIFSCPQPDILGYLLSTSMHCSHIPLVKDERKKFRAEEIQHRVKKYYQKVKTRHLYKIPLPHAF